MTMTVTAKINAIITATTPPTMATVVYNSAVSVVLLLDVVSILVDGVSEVIWDVVEGWDWKVWVVTDVGWVVSGHCASPNEVIATGHVSILTRIPCTATGITLLTHCWMSSISCTLVAWAVPCSLARNVTCWSEFGKHWKAYSVMYSALNPHWQTLSVFWTTAAITSLSLALVSMPYSK